MMGKIVGGITDAVGLTNHKGEAKAQKASAAAAKESLEMTKEQLEFQREQYYDWKDIYGDLQEQLDSYYKEYTGEDVVSQKLGETSKAYQGAEQDLTRSLAQRGLSGSGLEAQGLTSLAMGEASDKAGIRNSQESIANQQRLQFLGLGLGQGTAMLGTQAGVAQTGINAQASIAGQQSALQGKLSVANMGAMMETAKGVAGYATGKGYL